MSDAMSQPTNAEVEAAMTMAGMLLRVMRQISEVAAEKEVYPRTSNGPRSVAACRPDSSLAKSWNRK
jgi:hypothetical protein